MSSPLFTLSNQAKREFVAALEWSELHFGEAAAKRYQQLLRTAFLEIAQDIEAPGSKALDGFRLYHIRHCRKKAPVDGLIVKSPRHFLLYREREGVVEIARILHDQMNIEAKLRGMK